MSNIKLPAHSVQSAAAENEILFPDNTFRQICDNLPAVVAVYDINNSQYIYVNNSLQKILGYKPRDFIKGGLDFVSDLVHPDDLADIRRTNVLALKKINQSSSKDLLSEPITNFEYRLRHKLGHYVWLRTDALVFARTDGKVTQILNISIDITEQKNALIKLAKTHTKVETAERFALLQRVARVGTFEWFLPENKIIWSPEMEALHGLKPGSFKNTYDEVERLIHPDDRRRVSKTVKSAFKGGPAFSAEYRVVWPDGTVRWMLGRGKIVKDKANKPSRFVGVNVDITEQKEAETKLRASEERYQAFLSNSNEAIWRFELDEPIPTKLSPKKQIDLMFKHAYLAEANLAMAKMYGLKSAKNLAGARLGDMLIQSDPKNIAYLKAFIKSGYKLTSTESHEIDANGNDKYFNNSLIGVVENGMLVRSWGTQQDITEQHKAALELRRSEERLALALEASQLGIWEWDIETDELHWSPQLKRIFGLKPSTKINYERYIRTLHPDDRPKMQETIQSAMKTGESYQVEHRVIWPDGSIHWILGQGKAYLANGKPVRMTGTSLNIDERKKKAELEAVTKRLIAERKLLMQLNAAKDEFISIASHQLRTPATAVKQYLGMLLAGYAGKLSLSKKQMAMINTAYDSNERQIQIIADLLRVAQVDAGKISLTKERVDLVGLIREVIEDLTKAFDTKKQTVKFNHPQGAVFAFIDRNHMRMVIENMLDNASKYSHDNTSIMVNLKKNRQHVLIKVTDRGVGITKTDQSKLFKKFSRIDNPLSMIAGGSGLGLYWVKKIISLHNGKVAVVSKVNEGTTFTVKLPNELND